MCIRALPIKNVLLRQLGLHNKDTFILKYGIMFNNAWLVNMCFLLIHMLDSTWRPHRKCILIIQMCQKKVENSGKVREFRQEQNVETMIYSVAHDFLKYPLFCVWC